MPDIWLTKAPDGALRPADAEAVEHLKRIKAGSTVLVSTKVPRNAKFHRKIFSLLNWAYANVELPESDYKGAKITPSFDRFRDDLVIMAGFYDVVGNMKGEARAEAHSLAYDKCSQDKAERIYSALLDVIAGRLFNGSYTAEELEELTNQWMAYA